MRAPGFWDDQERASGVSAEYSRAKRRLEGFGELEARFADLESTEELLREELSGRSRRHHTGAKDRAKPGQAP